jgi:hypothetical protein
MPQAKSEALLMSGRQKVVEPLPPNRVPSNAYNDEYALIDNSCPAHSNQSMGAKKKPNFHIWPK